MEAVFAWFCSSTAGGTEKALKAVFAEEIRAVEVVVADANVDTHEAVALRAARNHRAERCSDAADVQIEQPILDVIRLVGVGQREPGFRTLHLVVHGVMCLVLIARERQFLSGNLLIGRAAFISQIARGSTVRNIREHDALSNTATERIT